MTSKPEKTEEQIDQAFVEEYNKLCEKHKRRLTFRPDWRFSADGNDYRLTIVSVVSRWPKEEK